MEWQEIWRGLVAGGREVVVHEEDEGDIRVSTTTKDSELPSEHGYDSVLGAVCLQALNQGPDLCYVGAEC